MEFSEDEPRRSNPLSGTDIRNPGPSWLEDNGFVTREDEYEDIFRECHLELTGNKTKTSIFSRVISKSRDDESW